MNDRRQPTSVSFRVRVGSVSETMSARFAIRLLPEIGPIRGRTAAPVGLTVAQYLKKIPFTAVRSLNWVTALDHLRAVADKGANTIILSEKYLDWYTPWDVINKDLSIFEDTLQALSIDVVLAERFAERQRAELPQRFANVKTWHEASIADVLQAMWRGYEPSSLVCPYGNLPYFLLDPAFDGAAGETEVRAWVGFQPWQCEQVLSRWPVTRFPMKHNASMVQGKPVPEHWGTIPLLLRL